MTKMKKLAAVLLALLMLVLVASCGANTEDVATSMKKPSTTATTKAKKSKTTTKFTYTKDDVKVVEVDGVKRAQAKGKDVPYTGVAPGESPLWWYVKDGIVDEYKTGIVTDTQRNASYYAKNGMLQGDYTGIKPGDGAYWYVNKGVVDKSVTSVVYDPDLANWYYVKNGEMQGAYTGLASNDAGYWFVRNGALDTTTDAVIFDQNLNGFYYVKDGMLQAGFTGIAKNDAGLWYVDHGQVDFSKNGEITEDGITYTINGGKATVKPVTTTAVPVRSGGQSNSSSRYYILNTNTGKFHVDGCRGLKRANSGNLKEVYDTRDNIMARGYSPCGICHP